MQVSTIKHFNTPFRSCFAKNSMYRLVFVFLIVMVIIHFPKKVAAAGGNCTCICCVGSPCVPKPQQSFDVDACSSCTDSRCRNEYPATCPAATETGDTSASCDDYPTTPSTTSTIPPTTSPGSTSSSYSKSTRIIWLLVMVIRLGF
jgi:hypothetical protein